MEKTWKFACVCFVSSFFKLCNGFPIHFERNIADPQIQVLSGVLAVIVTICTLLLIAGCLCCQRGTGFKFRQQYYKQIKGVAMGNTISSIIAQILVEHIKQKIMIKHENTFHPRFVDDCLVITTPENIQKIVQEFNSEHRGTFAV
ncbi:hypothetical protein WA026_020992 [Henosepilachna vigintioctopunctata]|uniref:Reverse transcriptase domain-containing protein n=1 Tax=Henosepilachna vigintioctopunctata TaxID=420089 RepID=A0AAW1VHI1_9CUCU